ncbi:LCCL domain-containing protein [Gemmata sp.]|uniref:LCCL domain-containing protein n=1 Tax=Gemmata sp. TaxID=1914242 RepID=UPI003F6EB839
MPVTRLLFRPLALAVPVTLAAAVFAPLTRGTATAAPDRTAPEPARAAGLDVEVKCVDDSTLKLKLLEDKLELVTRYGFLQVTVADVRRIEFAHRCPPEVAERIALAISKLAHADFQTREQATTDLKNHRERAYPFLLKTLKHDDPEVSRRADEALRFIQAKVPAPLLEARDSDVVYTEDSKFTGKLTAQSFRVLTGMFGEQSLKVADMRSLRTGAGIAADEFAGAVAAPATMATYQQQFGKEFVFNLTGHAPGNGQQATVWGTDVYTLDSNLAAAAVHAGLAKPGEAVAVRVRVVQSPLQFTASFRNGVNSNAYGTFASGGYEFVKR